jgi:putative ABC transport system permease protein
MKLTWRLFWCDLRAGEFTLLLMALILAVTATTTLRFFSSSLEQALAQQASRLLGADVVLQSSRGIRPEWPQLAQKLKLQQTQTLEFSTVAQQGDGFQLSSVKAVSSPYPLRGQLALNGIKLPSNGIPQHKTIWVEERLLALLNTRLGDTITLGEANFTVAATIAIDADMGGGFSAFSPKIIMNMADVPATRAIQQGSRANYRLLLAGNAKAVTQFKQQATPLLTIDERVRDVASANRQLSKPMTNAGNYLSLASIAAVLLAGIAVALAAQRFAVRHFDSLALMRCLGSSRRAMMVLYGKQLALIWLTAMLIGGILGWLCSLVLFNVLASLLPVQNLSFELLQPLVTGISTATLTLIGFALPALLRLGQVSPLRVLRRELSPNSWSTYSVMALALVALFALLSLETGNLLLTSIVLGGGVLLTALIASLCYWLLKRLGRQSLANSYYQQAIATLSREPRTTISQVLALALGLTAVLLVSVIRDDLFNQWQQDLPANTPNQFAVTIPATEKDALAQVLKQNQWAATDLYPVVRGRLVAINGKDTKAAQVTEEKESKNDNALNRELNLAWAQHLPPKNPIIAGQWFTGQQNEVSVEKELAARLNIKLGDTVSLQMAEGRIDAKITSLREVDWDSFQPNFYFIFPSHVLQHYPATYLTSFYVPTQDRALLPSVIRQFPTVIFIDLATMLSEVQKLLAQLSQGVLVILVFVILAGFLVLIASLAASVDTRLQEAALLRALGAKRQQLQARLGMELGILGLWAGLLAVVLTEIMTAVITLTLLEGNVQLHPYLWLTPLLSATLVMIIGLFNLRRVWQVSPMLVLKEG